MADPNDGWELVEREDKEEPPVDPNDVDVGEPEPEDPFSECFD